MCGCHVKSNKDNGNDNALEVNVSLQGRAVSGMDRKEERKDDFMGVKSGRSMFGIVLIFI